MESLSREVLQREYRKHFELAETASRFAAQVKALKEHYRAPGGDASKELHFRGGGNDEEIPEYYFVRVVHFAEGDPRKAQSVCASYNHRSGYGCNKGAKCTFKHHVCAFCHKDSHLAYGRQRNGTHGVEYFSCEWLRGMEAERERMMKQFALDARTAEGMERLVILSRPVPRPRRPALPAGPAPIGLKNRFAAGTETESEDEESGSEARAAAWEEPQESACPAPPLPADSERMAAGGRARSAARAVSRAEAKAGARGRKAAAGSKQRGRSTAGATSSGSAAAPSSGAPQESAPLPAEAGTGATELKPPPHETSSRVPHGESSSQEVPAEAGAWPTPLEATCPAPPESAPLGEAAVGSKQCGRSTVGATSSGSAAAPSSGAHQESAPAAPAEAGTGATEPSPPPHETNSQALRGESSSQEVAAEAGTWPTPSLESAPLGASRKAAAGSQQRGRSTAGATSSGSAAPPSSGAPQEWAPAASAEAGTGATEPSPPHETSSRAPRGESSSQEVAAESGDVEMPARAKGIPEPHREWLLREMLDRREEQLRESREEVAQLEARMASLERSLQARIASLEQGLRSRDERLATYEGMLLGQGTGEVLGDTGSSVAGAASAAASSSTPEQRRLVEEKSRALTLEVKNRVKMADKYPEWQLSNPGDLLALMDSLIEREGDPAKRRDLELQKEEFREQVQAANAARHGNMRSAAEPAGTGDLGDFDGTWRSVNGHRSIRDVQDREDEAEIATLEKLALFFHTEQPLKLVLQGLGLGVQDEIFSKKNSRSTVAFASISDIDGFKSLEEKRQLPRCIKSVEPYKYLEKWPRLPRSKEAAVRFKNMNEDQPVEDFLRALTKFGPVHDVCVKKAWDSTGNAFLGFVEFQDQGGAQRLLDSRFQLRFGGKEHLVLRGPSMYVAFQAWA